MNVFEINERMLSCQADSDITQPSSRFFTYRKNIWSGHVLQLHPPFSPPTLCCLRFPVFVGIILLIKIGFSGRWAFNSIRPQSVCRFLNLRCVMCQVMAECLCWVYTKVCVTHIIFIIVYVCVGVCVYSYISRCVWLKVIYMVMMSFTSEMHLPQHFQLQLTDTDRALWVFVFAFERIVFGCNTCIL